MKTRKEKTTDEPERLQVAGHAAREFRGRAFHVFVFKRATLHILTGFPLSWNSNLRVYLAN